jgi:hypothetical protein
MHCLDPKHVKLIWMSLTAIQYLLLRKMKIFCKDRRCASIEKFGDTNLDWKEETSDMGCRVLMWHNYM